MFISIFFILGCKATEIVVEKKHQSSKTVNLNIANCLPVKPRQEIALEAAPEMILETGLMANKGLSKNSKLDKNSSKLDKKNSKLNKKNSKLDQKNSKLDKIPEEDPSLIQAEEQDAPLLKAEEQDPSLNTSLIQQMENEDENPNPSMYWDELPYHSDPSIKIKEGEATLLPQDGDVKATLLPQDGDVKATLSLQDDTEIQDVLPLQGNPTPDANPSIQATLSTPDANPTIQTALPQGNPNPTDVNPNIFERVTNHFKEIQQLIVDLSLFTYNNPKFVFLFTLSIIEEGIFYLSVSLAKIFEYAITKTGWATFHLKELIYKIIHHSVIIGRFVYAVMNKMTPCFIYLGKCVYACFIYLGKCIYASSRCITVRTWGFFGFLGNLFYKYFGDLNDPSEFSQYYE